jgi:hypothetical protein
MAFFWMQQICALFIGVISHYIGAPNTLLVQGIVAVIIAFIFLPFLGAKGLEQNDDTMFPRARTNNSEIG